MTQRSLRRLLVPGAVLLILLSAASCQLPKLAAGAILHPFKRPVTAAVPDGCQEITFTGEGGITLHGWRGPAIGKRRGTVIYLHGMADNRASGAGVIGRFRPRGFDVIAYDSRAHGQSGGPACTYGFYEKHDLHRVIDALPPGLPVVLIGSSLGGAVALQEAAGDPRVSAIVAAETFSDLRTVATERAPFFFTQSTIDRSFQLAEQEAGSSSTPSARSKPRASSKSPSCCSTAPPTPTRRPATPSAFSPPCPPIPATSSSSSPVPPTTTHCTKTPPGRKSSAGWIQWCRGP